MATGTSTAASSATSNQISNYCGLLGTSAGVLMSGPDIQHFDVESATTYISDRTAFDFSETKSRMGDIAKNASLTSLTPAEFAGHTYFWCVYDLVDIDPGTEDVFDIERRSIEVFQTMFNPKNNNDQTLQLQK